MMSKCLFIFDVNDGTIKRDHIIAVLNHVSSILYDAELEHLTFVLRCLLLQLLLEKPTFILKSDL